MKVNSRNIHVLIFISGLTTLFVQSVVLPRRSAKPPEAPRNSGSERVEAKVAVAASAGKHSESNPHAVASRVGNEYVPMTPPRRWRALANVPFTLVDPKSLELKDVVSDLLELAPEQSKELEMAIAKLLDEVRGEEVKHAFIRVKGDGTQEVVVASFDRGPLLKKFRDSVAAKFGDDIGDFCAQEALYDDTLAVGNKEVRIYTLRGLSEREAKFPTPPGGSKYAEAMQKVERLMISRGVHQRNRSGKPEWEGEAAPPRESTLSQRGDYGPRYWHLQEAMSGLPRKAEPVK